MLSYDILVQTLHGTYNSTSYVINYVHHSNFFVAFFRAYYEGRRADGLKVEKANSIYAKGGYTDKEAERNILSNPFKRFERNKVISMRLSSQLQGGEPQTYR